MRVIDPTELGAYAEFLDPHFYEAIVQSSLPTYFASARGSWLFDTAGEKYLDLCCNYGAAHLGHNHPQIISIIADALHAHSLLLPPFGFSVQAAELANKICELAGRHLAKVAFCCSGSEAVTTAFNMARSITGRKRSVHLRGEYHGHLLSDHPDNYPCDDLERLVLELRSGTVAAAFVELVQGSNGAEVLNAGEVGSIAETCKDTGSLLVIDEVLTGFGRTGRWFAFHEYPASLLPDIVICSKALTGGLLPVSAMVMTDSIYESAAHETGIARYRSTLSAHMLGILASTAMIGQIEEQQLLENVTQRSQQLTSQLTVLKDKGLGIMDVRGRGLLIAFRLRDAECCGTPQSLRCLQDLCRHSVLTSLGLKAPEYVTLTPALNISESEVSFFLDRLEEVLLTPGACCD